MWEALSPWLQTHEYIAIWLEGIALILILGLDCFEWRNQHRERKEHRREVTAQLAVSQKQVELSQEQVEATLRPCVSLSMAPREMEAAVLAVNETDSTVIVRCPGGLIQIENMGVGPAVNIRYEFSTVQPHESSYSHPTGYVAGLAKEGVFLIPVSRTLLAGHDFESLIEYESVSHRKYRTRVTLNDLVITNMRFEVVPQEA
jgi:hypothetical protein